MKLSLFSTNVFLFESRCFCLNKLDHGFNKPFKKQIRLRIQASMIMYDYKYQTKVEPIPFFPPKRLKSQFK